MENAVSMESKQLNFLCFHTARNPQQSTSFVVDIDTVPKLSKVVTLRNLRPAPSATGLVSMDWGKILGKRFVANVFKHEAFPMSKHFKQSGSHSRSKVVKKTICPKDSQSPLIVRETLDEIRIFHVDSFGANVKFIEIRHLHGNGSKKKKIKLPKNWVVKRSLTLETSSHF